MPSKQRHITIYGDPQCGYTVHAMDMVNANIHLFSGADALHISEIPESLEARIPPSHTTMPAVFVNDKFVGGARETERLIAAARAQ